MLSRLTLILELAERRVDILRRLAAGRTRREVAEDLGRSVDMVYEHLRVTKLATIQARSLQELTA